VTKAKLSKISLFSRSSFVALIEDVIVIVTGPPVKLQNETHKHKRKKEERI